MLPNFEQRKIAIIDVINQLGITGSDSSSTYVYIKFKKEYPKLKTRNRPEWEALFSRMVEDGLLNENSDGCSVTDKGNKYYSDLTRGSSASISVEHSRNVQIGDGNVMSVSYIIDSFNALEKKIQDDDKLDPKEKETIIGKIRATVDNMEYLKKIPEISIYLSELFSKITG